MALINTTKVKIHLMKQADSQAAYDAMVDRESNTLYILGNGRGYLGETLMFTGDDITANLVQVVDDTNKTVTDKSASVKAMVDYVTDVLDTTNLVKTKFFRNVTRYVITADDIAGTGAYGKLADAYNETTNPGGCNVGDVGILFTADNNGVLDGNGVALDGEMYYWICLNDLINIYTGGSTNSITTTVDGAGVIKSDLRVKAGETILTVDADGVSINKATSISLVGASDDKVATEKAVLDFVVTSLNTALADLVKFEIETEVTP